MGCMNEPVIRLLLSLAITAVYFFLLYLVVKAAMIAALRQAGPNLSHTNEMLRIQADLTARLAKHLIAQSDLMLITARNDGVTDEQLAPVQQQLAERKAADSGFSLPFR
jgi:hypothetical protein